MPAQTYIEIAVEDSERALRFYGNVFNWAYFRAPSETPYYVMGELNGYSLAGIFPAAFAPQTLPFVKAMAGQFERTLQRIRKHGGRIIEAHPEEGLGSVAQWKDPEGHRYGLTEPYDGAPATAVSDNKVLWRPRRGSTVYAGPAYVEVGVTNEKRALDFFRNVFGWSMVATSNGGTQYHFAGNAGATAIAAIRPTATKTRETIPHFSTHDVSGVLRRVEKYGGDVIHGGRRQAGTGVVAQCQDPDGNVFGLTQFSKNATAQRIPATKPIGGTRSAPGTT